MRTSVRTADHPRRGPGTPWGPAALAAVLAAGILAPGDLAALEYRDGMQEAVIRFAGRDLAPLIGPYANSGSVQSVLHRGESAAVVRVSSSLHPLGNATPFPAPAGAFPDLLQPFVAPEPAIQSTDALIARAAAEAVRGSQSQAGAVEAVLEFIARRVAYERTATGPNDAGRTLAQERGSCIGLSNLAVAMLRSAGIPARNVHGLLVPARLIGRPAVAVNSNLLHRWIEVYYPGTGWVFSDPTQSWNFAGALHVRWSSAMQQSARPFERLADLRVQLLSYLDASYTIAAPPGKEALAAHARANRAPATGALLLCAVRNSQGGAAASGAITIRGRGGSTRKPIPPNGLVAFPGLAPGLYTLTGTVGGRRLRESVIVGEGERLLLDFSEPGSAIAAPFAAPPPDPGDGGGV